jgi:hypothetical protein
MSSPGRGTFLAGLLAGLGISSFVVLLFAGIWFFTPALQRETTMKLPYAAGHAVPAASVTRQFAKSEMIPVVGPPACPPGYYLGPKGRRCWPLGYGRSAGEPPPPGYGPPPGEGPFAEYTSPPHRNPGNLQPNQNASPPPAKPPPPPGPETGPHPNE